MVQVGTPTPVNFLWPPTYDLRPLTSLSLDVVVTRGSIVESYHRVHAAVVRDDMNTEIALRRHKALSDATPEEVD